jgi:hypothetical protein
MTLKKMVRLAATFSPSREARLDAPNEISTMGIRRSVAWRKWQLLAQG